MCPIKPKRPCSYPNCYELTYERYCDKHRQEMDIEYSRNNRPFKHLYNTSRWKKARKLFLQDHPLCEECKRSGVVKAATIIDHVEAHKGDEELFWNQTNWQSLCKECHDRKTAKVDDRWGKKGRVYTY